LRRRPPILTARDKERFVSKKTEKSTWTGTAALAGAAIGSAAVAAALLYASRRKERAEKPATPVADVPETD
jgi:hypothetical protein